MAYYNSRRRTRSRGFYRRPNRYNRFRTRVRKSYRTTGQATYRAGSMSSRLMKKFVKYNVDNTSVSAADTWENLNPATAGCLNAVATGVAEDQRSGSRIVGKVLHVNAKVVLPAVESQTDPIPAVKFRLIFFQDNRTTGSAPTPSDIMSGPAADPFLADKKTPLDNRYTILREFRGVLRRPNTNEGAANLFAAAEVEKAFSFTRRLNFIQNFFQHYRRPCFYF